MFCSGKLYGRCGLSLLFVCLVLLFFFFVCVCVNRMIGINILKTDYIIMSILHVYLQ